ncbi:Putative Flp pilus-assembly TadE/G-like [Pedococcus dokdonensis]|uniref:Putative Flp pilus-assembly TadE/G-like n=1 Tax=Pedococcus dokdonensis TaxID=443156 RepID=A0A1H0R5A2_9MICO|nr:pilus assembly protein TadG-related protein [Pedococcus dokdonensis]SDP24148.1 Putative Flp pilus-assembly TadE/G-like [Pedococcus dokdonensis]
MKARRGRAESGQVSLLVLGFTVVVILLVVGTVAVTSVQLSRMRLLDAADAAALAAAGSLDVGAYADGLEGSVALDDSGVRRTAVDYLAQRPRPESLVDWQVAPGTGSPDGRTAVVRITGRARVPLVGGLLESVGGSVTITVESRARADLSAT